MEDGLWPIVDIVKVEAKEVLILVVMEDGLWQRKFFESLLLGVLILVVMEDGLWHHTLCIIE